MQKASVILKNTRQDKDLDLAEVSKKLKISIKYLLAIESEDRRNYPREPYCSLIVKDYASYLGLNSQDVLALFRRDFEAISDKQPKNKEKYFLTPQFTFKIATVLSVIIFITYLITEYLKFNRPPFLKINWPTADFANQSILDINGTTDPESTVRINNDLVIVDPTGNFQKKINLSGTEFKVIIESKSPSGKTTTSEKVYYSK